MTQKKAAHNGATVTKKRHKDNAIFQLRQLYLTKHYEKLPSIPEYARCTPLYQQRTSNGLTRCVLDWLRLSGHQAERISNTGRLIDGTKVVTNCLGFKHRIGSVHYIKGSGTNGTAEVSSTIAGRSVKIEIKLGADRQSAAQRRYQADVERSGGVYLIVHDFQSFLSWYELFMSGLNNGR